MGISVETFYYFIGNGFDLASDLKTTYSAFMESRWKEYEKTIILFDNFFTKNVYFKKDSFYYGGNKDECIIFKTYMEEIVQDLKNSSLSIWDLLFRFLYINKVLIKNVLKIDNNEIVNWSDVELVIERVVMSINSDNCFFKSMFDDNFFPDEPQFTKIPNLNGLENCESIVLLKEILHYCFITNSALQETYSENAICSYALKELNKFENSFAKRISGFMEKMYEKNDMSDTKKLDYYQSNLKKILQIGSESALNYQKHYIVNFNYSNFMEWSNKYNYDIAEYNVHGSYYGEIIFGIDQKEVDYKNSNYKFSKTSRKLFSKNENPSNFKFESKDVTKALVFFGHSLAKADYSYFQTFFDYYNIYSGNIKLIFYYSIYRKEEEEFIKTKSIDSISRLINEYGKTMNNKDHGKNLLHKLLLERRLFISAIEDDFFYKINI